MNHDLWLHKDCGQGPWPLYLDTTVQRGSTLLIERQCLGLHNSTDEPSGIYLRSLQQRARIKIESLIAMEQHQ